MAAKGAVACGHRETAAAAAEILADGGSAFDAALAAMASACVAEPVLASLAGGGFLLAHPADGPARVYDFFVDTPLVRRDERDIDFYPVLADFGTATQEFHIGLGAAATPGALAGFFKIYDDLASLPARRLVEPAQRIAREGFIVGPMDHFLYTVVGRILLASDELRARFAEAGDPTKPVAAGRCLVQPDLADALGALAEEGTGLLYEGELGERLCRLCREEGGQLTREDLARYRVQVREPLEVRYRDALIQTNPPPSAGGILIAFALDLLDGADLPDLDPKAGLAALARAMDLTNKARLEARLHEASGDDAERAAIARLFDPSLLRRYRDTLLGRPFSPRGTTHISVADAAGNLAAMTLSNGEGCGRLLPGTGILLNNMLGEEDLSPAGFHLWRPGTRMASMMAPTIAEAGSGRVAALGSGGSNRIRSAVLQVVLHLVDRERGAQDAVEAPRLHIEGAQANLEAGFPEGSERLLAEAFDEVRSWPERNLFFGGAHVVTRDPSGNFEAAGDPRRGGIARLV
jgi:gamma-glutamyltranspeptidase/glutathione hydrolase